MSKRSLFVFLLEDTDVGVDLELEAEEKSQSFVGGSPREVVTIHWVFLRFNLTIHREVSFRSYVQGRHSGNVIDSSPKSDSSTNAK